ncbi:MAG: hypothetical protein CML67_03075 [Rhodobacteraceae bacterium]|nr:hypothetical protein [Paracoccaceae bacterium]
MGLFSIERTQPVTDSKPWPTEIRLAKDKKQLTVAFDTGESHTFDAEYLRVCSPSAEVQGHSPAQKQTVPGKRDVGIMQIEPVGNYAVRIHFDDLHNTGIFSWDYFLKLARDRDEMWGGYLKDLEAKGLSRDPKPRK